MKFRICLVVTLFGLVFLVGQDASAQRRRGMFGGANRVQLVFLEQVQKELKLNDEQKKNFVELFNRYNADRRELFQSARDSGSFDFNDLRVKTSKLSAEADEKLAGKLKEEQTKRLTEIFVQVNGANSLSDKTVGKALKFTEEQTKKLAEARTKNQEAMMETFRNARDLSQEERREAFAKLRKEGDERLLTVLTKEQKEQFGKMKGKEIEIDMGPLRGNFRRGGGGGGNSDRPGRPD